MINKYVYFKSGEEYLIGINQFYTEGDTTIIIRYINSKTGTFITLNSVIDSSDSLDELKQKHPENLI